ncbi:hypothetical protein CDD80_3774 [Ophiocordyceps camponoti-rufipedis]|uniref:Glycoside hydrolase family 2 immunoglobulin-like beta-sandwich domain-containing protein n=1 Tax=Ophiocordyceps camponoti-rufipedis TaxID=2004952 RepID=A0A2C5ZKI9_9HYPO|nr:hypothetical protein CDD80_3774 [Ophiocordyceps camponoti-rufipedis]
MHPYPRPDFQRTRLSWQSLNGPWNFLFDDDDVGLTSRWHHHGLPPEVAIRASPEAAGIGGDPGSDGITQRIAAGTQELIKDDTLIRAGAETVRQRCTIQVPFVFQCPASGINDRGVHEVLWYERQISDLRTPEDKQHGHRLLLRFGAVDYEARIWVNGHFVGHHRGGHVPFDLDVTDALDAGSDQHRLTVRVFDSAYDLTQPRGKQYWGAQPESIFYTPSGGIWQSVWVEVVPQIRIGDSSHGTVLRSNDIETGQLGCHVSVLGRRQGQGCSVQVETGIGGIVVTSSERKAVSKETSSVDLAIDMRLSQQLRSRLPASLVDEAPLSDSRCWSDGVALWSPEHPLLYDVAIRLFDSQSGELVDEVRTQVGMRSIEWSGDDGLWRLNKKPYFQALCLDQGYWRDSFMTPPNADSVKLDIELAKRMGFNGCRKHQKVEDPVFYYWADKLGYLVWAEMANSYQFSVEYVDRFNQEWTEAVKLAINHASVVTWTPVNETWGYPSLKDNEEQQHHVRLLYHLTKTLDPTRSINDNCGWEHVCTDLTTFHDYSDAPELEKTCASLDLILGPKAGRDLFVGKAKHRPGAPIMCTEFGGVNIAPNKAEGASDRDWGYTTASDAQDLLARFERLVKGITGGGYCCAFVYTQLTDIEQEVNGLYTFDRKPKLDAAKVKAVMDEAVGMFYKRVGT